MAHTDEHGKSAPAKSKIARKMRVVLRGQADRFRKGTTKFKTVTKPGNRYGFTRGK